MEDFVPFELAKKLEGLGFDESSLFFYREDDEDKCVHCVDINKPLIDDKVIIAPTISQVLKWLREECGIFILVEPDILSPKYKLTFTLRVKYYIKGEEDEGFSEKYLTYRKDSYELAVLTGIEYVLDNLI